MITTQEGLQQAIERLGRVYKTLARMRTEHQNGSPSWRAVMAEGWVEQARQLEREIEVYCGAAAFEEARAELWLGIEGQGIGEGEGPVSVLTAILDAFRKGVQAVAEFRSSGRLGQRPTATLKAACDWRLVTLKAGSLKMGIRLPDVEQQLSLLPEGVHDVRQATADFLAVAAWAGQEEAPEVLDQQFPDLEYRRALLTAVKPFVPRPRGSVERVTISGRLAPVAGPIVLTKHAPPRIDAAIDRTAKAQVEDHEGDLREIDLDNLTFTVRNLGDVQEVRCTFDESLLGTAIEALDRRVKVFGVRQVESGKRGRTTLHVFRLEVLEEQSPASSDGAAANMEHKIR
jgi:hypothetical protein